MVEFNLLPDVKMQHLKTKRLEYLVITASFVIGAASILVFILMFLFVDVAQKVRINNLNNDITNTTAQLNSNKDLNQILTVQNQLGTIPTLENQSPTASRLFGYLSQVTPVSATISNLSISFSADDIVVTGGADSLDTVNTFVDTLKYATYNNLTTKTKNVTAFKSVVLTSFSYNNNANNGQATQYTISFDFDPILFNSADNVSLVVPSEITTRSILNQPTLPDLFKSNPTATPKSP